ncbi:uroporphyrinogen-III synthase [Acetobacteraceae bacterium H6797]|nr:uroporphyrinogen-III synthase [Acetobacteraceae bacterium H6797]
MMARAVLLTRPEPGLSETRARLEALGWPVVEAPALVIAPVSLRLAARPAAILLASRSALPALDDLPRDIPLFAVGAGSAAAAEARGFTTVEAAEGDAAHLVPLVAARLSPQGGPLLLPVGEGYGKELAAALRAHDFRVWRRVAYRVRPSADLPPAARQAISTGQVAAALFYSPRSAACAMKLWRAAGLADAAREVEALALSPRIATTLAGLPWRRVRTAERPDQDLLIDLLGPGPGGKTAGAA